MRRERLPGARGIELSLVRYAEGERATLLLLHGFLDAAATFDELAAPLAQAGYAVYAPDLRGFGASDRVGRGGYYHFPDYVADVDALARALAPRRLVLVGHSMGGTVACLYAGSRPERCAGLVLLEGLGPPAMPADAGLHRTRQWLSDLEEERPPKPLSLDEAARRLAANHPRVPAEVLRRRAEQLTRVDGGERFWSHDPLHRTTSPVPFSAPTFREFLRQVACPVLYVGGGEDGYHPPDEAERLACFRDVAHVELPGAGHMLHWTAPAATARAILDFCARIA